MFDVGQKVIYFGAMYRVVSRRYSRIDGWEYQIAGSAGTAWTTALFLSKYYV